MLDEITYYIKKFINKDRFIYKFSSNYNESYIIYYDNLNIRYVNSGIKIIKTIN